MITSAICIVNGISSQKPPPQIAATSTSPVGVASSAAATTTTVASSANTNASGIQRSVQAVVARATRASAPVSAAASGVTSFTRVTLSCPLSGLERAPRGVYREAMRLDTYVNYCGVCEEAFRYYAEHLGGHVSSLVRHGSQPNPQIPADWADRVLHARLDLGGMVLMGADVPSAEPMRSAYLTLSLDSDAEAERVYAVLTDGGKIFMPMRQTPFASRFAMLRDRFGASCMLLHQTAEQGAR